MKSKTIMISVRIVDRSSPKAFSAISIGRVAAIGVCVVCGVPCCDECGSKWMACSVCIHHVTCEMFEGMVKVYGTHEEAEAEFTKSRLDAGLHPALFHLRRSRDRGHVEYEVYEENENFNASEIKVMVPCEEVADAESMLKSPPESSQR